MKTTRPGRGWFINPLTRNADKWWLGFLAIIPALLATILIFMDQHITSVIVNRRENKLNVSLYFMPCIDLNQIGPNLTERLWLSFGLVGDSHLHWYKLTIWFTMVCRSYCIVNKPRSQSQS
jgi:hypothetical protein